MKNFGIEEIKNIIPHRDPFLFLDEIIELTPGETVSAKKVVKKDEFWVRGHFPSFAVCPGVIAIEMLAQAGAVCILALPQNKGRVALFAGINKARFKKQIFPGDEVILNVNIVKMIGDIGVGKAQALVDGKIAVLAEIMFALKDYAKEQC